MNICLYRHYYAALVSFGNVTDDQSEAVGKFGVAVYSWDEFLQLVVSYFFIVFTTVLHGIALVCVCSFP